MIMHGILMINKRLTRNVLSDYDYYYASIFIIDQ